MENQKETSSLIILGGGPAGMTASIYASRYKTPHLIIAPEFGGAAKEAHQIENWPGIKKIKGSELMEMMLSHVKEYNPILVNETAKKLQKTDLGFSVLTSSGQLFETKSIIFAGGTQHKRLSVPGEKELLGRGVSYCATCDGAFFKNKTIAVIGGANSAIMASIELAEHASKIYLIFRGEELKGEPIWIDRVKQNPKIILVPKTNLTKIIGENKVKSVELDTPFEGKNEIFLDGVFIEIGVSPLVDILKDLSVELDDLGNIIVSKGGMTNVEGLFAAGDATNGSSGFRQIITASAEGAICAKSVFEYLKSLN